MFDMNENEQSIAQIYNAAIQSAEQILLSDPEDEKALRAKQYLLYAYAYVCNGKGYYARAIEQCSKLQKMPGITCHMQKLIFRLLGWAHRELQEFTTAEKYLLQGIKLEGEVLEEDLKPCTLENEAIKRARIIYSQFATTADDNFYSKFCNLRFFNQLQIGKFSDKSTYVFYSEKKKMQQLLQQHDKDVLVQLYMELGITYNDWALSIVLGSQTSTYDPGKFYWQAISQYETAIKIKGEKPAICKEICTSMSNLVDWLYYKKQFQQVITECGKFFAKYSLKNKYNPLKQIAILALYIASICSNYSIITDELQKKIKIFLKNAVNLPNIDTNSKECELIVAALDQLVGYYFTKRNFNEALFFCKENLKFNPHNLTTLTNKTAICKQLKQATSIKMEEKMQGIKEWLSKITAGYKNKWRINGGIFRFHAKLNKEQYQNISSKLIAQGLPRDSIMQGNSKDGFCMMEVNPEKVDIDKLQDIEVKKNFSIT